MQAVVVLFNRRTFPGEPFITAPFNVEALDLVRNQLRTYPCVSAFRCIIRPKLTGGAHARPQP